MRTFTQSDNHLVEGITRHALAGATGSSIWQIQRLDDQIHIRPAQKAPSRVTAGPVQSNVRVWGYPADPPFTGEIPYYCDGSTTAVAFSSDASFPCGMNGGASGGPWLKDRINVNVGYTWAITSRCETTPGTTDCALTNLRSTPNTPDVVTMFNLM